MERERRCERRTVSQTEKKRKKVIGSDRQTEKEREREKGRRKEASYLGNKRAPPQYKTKSRRGRKRKEERLKEGRGEKGGGVLLPRFLFFLPFLFPPSSSFSLSHLYGKEQLCDPSSEGWGLNSGSLALFCLAAAAEEEEEEAWICNLALFSFGRGLETHV